MFACKKCGAEKIPRKTGGGGSRAIFVAHRSAEPPWRSGAVVLLLLMVFRGPDELAEQGVGLVGPGFQLRVELHSHEPGVVRQLHDLHQLPVGGQPGMNRPFWAKTSRNSLLNS